MKTIFYELKTMVLAFAFAVALSSSAHAREAKTDIEQVRAVMMKTWDKPEEKLQVNPVAVAGDYALASWLQGKRGGRAVLAWQGGQWAVTVCAGDGVLDADLLVNTGMSKAIAQTLVREMKLQESRLDAATRARFASFNGWMKVGGSENTHSHDHGKH